MPKLKAVDLKLVGELFGTGYVLDFTNRTFADFFRDEVGIDIYDDAYSGNGNSKGKRLRTFLQRGQKDAIVKALHGLWEYRVACNSGDKNDVDNSREKLSSLLERLDGPPLPTNHKPSSDTNVHQPSESKLRALESDFNVLLSMDDAAQARGYSFEKFLIRWFKCWNLAPKEAFRITGEQIDGSFVHGSTVHLLEAKWRNAQTGAADLRAFQGLVSERMEGTRGLFVSYSGFSEAGLKAFQLKNVILMNGLDISDALYRRIPIHEVLSAKLRIAVEEKRSFVQVRDLFQ